MHDLVPPDDCEEAWYVVHHVRDVLAKLQTVESARCCIIAQRRTPLLICMYHH